MTGWELGLVGLAALVIGISKTSVGGFAAMAVAVFATVLPAKDSTAAVMTLYLIAMRVEKLRFIGTSAWFFLIVNVSKVPFSAGLGLFRPESLRLVAALVPAVLVGTWLGVLLIRGLSQVTFERVALAGSALAAVALLVR